MSDLISAYRNMMQSGGCAQLGHEMTQSGFIPALPDDVFLKCLLRVPVQWHANLQKVSRNLRSLVQSKEYYEQREKEGTSTPFVCMLQPLPDFAVENRSHDFLVTPSSDPVYGVSVFDVQQQLWERLPPIEDLPGGLPTFCKIVALNGKLVVLGGWLNWVPSTSVFVYNFSSQTWRKGADMPHIRCFFASGALNGKVYVAGGHDDGKKALVSADIYDVESDCWLSLPSMSEERDECAGVMLDGKFYVVSGYKTERQGEFLKSGEIYDPARNLWTSIDNMWPFESEDAEVVSPGCLAAMSGCLYALHGKEIVAYSRERNMWSVVDKVPEGEKGEMTPSFVTSTTNFLVVAGIAKKNGVPNLRALSFTPAQGTCKAQWQGFATNDQFLTGVQSSCAIVI